MGLFIRIKEKDREKFFKNLKKEINIPWEQFYSKYQISKSMFYNYLRGKYDLPKNLFVEWASLSPIEETGFEEIEKMKYLPKKVKKVKMDQNLAEIFGVLNGDGHLSKEKYEICVVGDLKEKEYFIYLKELFEKKFKLKFNLRREKSAFKLRCYSKGLWEELTKNYGLPKGNKLGKLEIPKEVKENKEYLKRYFKGLHDTDGSFYIRREKDPVVQITNAEESYLNSCKEHLLKIGFKFSKGQQRIFLYGKENISRFFKEVKPSNTKHLKKYQIYLDL